MSWEAMGLRVYCFLCCLLQSLSFPCKNTAWWQLQRAVRFWSDSTCASTLAGEYLAPEHWSYRLPTTKSNHCCQCCPGCCMHYCKLQECCNLSSSVSTAQNPSYGSQRPLGSKCMCESAPACAHAAAQCIVARARFVFERTGVLHNAHCVNCRMGPQEASEWP